MSKYYLYLLLFLIRLSLLLSVPCFSGRSSQYFHSDSTVFLFSFSSWPISFSSLSYFFCVSIPLNPFLIPNARRVGMMSSVGHEFEMTMDNENIYSIILQKFSSCNGNLLSHAYLVYYETMTPIWCHLYDGSISLFVYLARNLSFGVSFRIKRLFFGPENAFYPCFWLNRHSLSRNHRHRST